MALRTCWAGERLAPLRALFGRAGWNYSARMTDSEHDGHGTGPAGGGQNWWHQYQQHAVSIDEQILTELRRNNALLERMNARMARGLAYRRSITFDIIGAILVVGAYFYTLSQLDSDSAAGLVIVTLIIMGIIAIMLFIAKSGRR
jgi:F0F1-type ATP synthase assembly protein I